LTKLQWTEPGNFSTRKASLLKDSVQCYVSFY